MKSVNRTIVVLGLLMLVVCLLGACDARLPQKGDRVVVSTMLGTSALVYWGNITDIGDGFLVMNATEAVLAGSTDENWEPKDVAIGIGSITSLVWPN